MSSAMRRSLFIPVAAAALLSLACTVRTSTSSSSSANDGKPVANDDGRGTGKPTQSDGKPIGKADDSTKPAEREKPKDANAAQRERMQKALAELEAEYKKDAERWTPELKAQAAKLVATKWRTTAQAMTTILKSAHRKEENKSRDKFRKPKETLVFFGIKPTHTVFEVGPGKGWWTEILAPLLGAQGKLRIATYDAASDDPMMAYFAKGIQMMLDSAPELYGKIETIKNPTMEAFEMGEPESLDAIMLMRMTHNLVRFKGFDKFLTEAHDTLKPGGILAIEQHRAKPDADPMAAAEKGYVPEKWLIEQVEAAGFKLEKKSEINANKKDTKDYEKGVWTLPPTYAEGDKDKAKYDAIGESDRMTLKFVKPKTKPAKKTTTTDLKGEVKPTHEGDKKKSALPDTGKTVKPPAESGEKKSALPDTGKTVKPPAE
jgi:predicted methyltransferase